MQVTQTSQRPDSRNWANIFVAVLRQFLNIRLREQPGIGYHNRMVEAMFPGQCLHYRDERLSLMDITLVNLVADGIAARCHQQAEEYLRAGMLPVLVLLAVLVLAVTRLINVENRCVSVVYEIQTHNPPNDQTTNPPNDQTHEIFSAKRSDSLRFYLYLCHVIDDFACLKCSTKVSEKSDMA